MVPVGGLCLSRPWCYPSEGLRRPNSGPQGGTRRDLATPGAYEKGSAGQGDTGCGNYDWQRTGDEKSRGSTHGGFSYHVANRYLRLTAASPAAHGEPRQDRNHVGCAQLTTTDALGATADTGPSGNPLGYNAEKRRHRSAHESRICSEKGSGHKACEEVGSRGRNRHTYKVR